ncbi:MAG TPA: amino acid adenylation domain-containing protein, partial [Thermoanaerobaculia bacterium]|nr:amino acid adenylation domain-containing protein [Thermoanaerobaculia bacterium]
PLPEPTLQYADFAVWQREWLTDGELEAQLDYWRSRLATVPKPPELLALPLDRPRTALPGSRGGRVLQRLPVALVGRLRALGRGAPGTAGGQQGPATLFMVLLAAWSAFLSRISGQEEVVVGTPIANRTRRETEGLIGFFVNTLALRTDVAGNPDFTALLGRVRQKTLADYAHQDLPFERLVGEVAERSLSHSPIFQVFLILQHTPAERLELPDLTLEVLPVGAEAVKFDLSLGLTESPQGLAGAWEYRASLFDRATVARLAGQFEILLGGLVARPTARLAELPLLAVAERQQLLEWSAGEMAAVPSVCLHELFLAQARRSPEIVAVVHEGERLTYRELADRVEHLAGMLRGLGVGPEVRVGVCLERTLALPVALLAVLAAGGAYVPLDPAYPEARLDAMLADSGAALLLTQAELAERRFSGAGAELGRRRLLLERSGLPAQALPIVPAGVRPVPANLAYLIYTSGSTGVPKGVAITHRSAVILAQWGRETFSQSELSGVLFATSVCFDLSVFELFVPLAWGGRVLLADDALALPRLAAAGEVRLVNTVPSALAELVRQGAVPAGVRTINLAGEALPQSLAEALYALPQVERVWNLYGPSEDTTYSTAVLLARGSGRKPGIGRPLPATWSYVLDGAGARVPIGVPGELFLGGWGLARGYLGRPELTAERFLPDPFGVEAGGRLYRTGDLVCHRVDGELEFLGRVDQQVKVRGFRIELGEIETALLNHSAVEQAAVVVRQEASGNPRLAAYVVARVGEEPASGPALRAFLGQRLPDYMIPASFVLLPALPLTPNGKVDRRALARLEPWAESGGQAGYVAPRTPIEELVAAIWSEVLAVERVGAEGNFFDLGGHSLLATRVISRVRQAFGVDLPLKSLFEATTVAAFGQRVESAMAAMTGLGRQLPPLVPIRRDQALPLSFAQERLWLIDRLQPGSAAYNMPAALRLSGGLDLAALAATFAELDRRHESLRTTFREVGGQPLQEVHPAAPPALPRVDLAGLPAERREGEARRLARAEARRPFDLVAGPLLRLTLLHLSGEPGEHLALFTQHHIVSDGWSMGVLVRELGALYSAFHGRRPSPLPEPTLQYADFAVWQREWLTDGELEAQLDYWRSRLATAPKPPELLALPLDRPRTALPGSRGGRVLQRLPEALVGHLRALGQGTGQQGPATLFMVLLAAWSAFLSRISGQEEVVVGTPIANRTRRETEGLIGCFVNTLALRTDLAGDPDFTALLGRVRQKTLADYAHQDLPFERLVGEVAERSLSHSPLFQVFLILQNTPVERLELPDLTLEVLPVGAEAVKFDLSLGLTETPQGLAGTWEYRASFFDRATVARLAGHFETLLGGLVAHPAARLAELPLLAATERQQLLEWSAGEGATVPAVCLHELFLAQARRVPEIVAVVHGEERLTYRELAAQVERLAGMLRGLGVGPEVRVGVCFERTLALPVALLAVLAAGGAYVPLDPAFPPERLRLMLADCGARLLLTQAELVERLPETAARRVLLAPSGRPAARLDQLPAGTAPVPENLAYVLYTSGSTGRPKGVEVRHSGVVAFLAAMASAPGLGATDILLAVTTVSFDIAALELFLPLAVGGRVVLASRETATDGGLLAAALARVGATALQATPATWRLLLAAGWRGEPGLKALCGGEALPRDLAAELLGRVGALWNLYGPTETTIWSTLDPVLDNEPGEGAVPIGRPIPGTRARVLDRHLERLPVGVAGELWLGGAGVARGYHGRPDLTAERFLPDPWSPEPGARLYRTGDVVRYLPTGRLVYLGRADQQVKVRGFRIEPGEIEAVLAGHPAVRQAVVTAREDRPGDRRLVAYVVAREEVPDLPAVLSALAAERLPAYLVPAAFVVLPTLPLTPNGKLDRGALPAPEWQSAATYVPPATPFEEMLAAIWAELLGVERVGAGDDFFALGGHSFLATRVVSRLREAFGVEVPVRALFERPTVRQLAAMLEAAVKAEGTRAVGGAIRPVPRTAALPLSFSQERLWFLDQLDPGQVAYNLPLPIRLTGTLVPAALAAALAEEVRRHEVLRTSFGILAGRPVQRIAPAAQHYPLPVVDLTGLPAGDRQPAARRLVAAESARPFDLEHGPLLRALLLRLGGDPPEHLLLLTLHHSVADGWSLGVLTRELVALYAAGAAGRPSPLPELAVQYADFALWQRGWLRGERLAAELDYWRERLAGIPESLELPFDHPRPAVESFRGGMVPFALPAGLVVPLSALARRHGATLSM